MEGEMVEWDRKRYEEREKEGKKERKKEMTALVLKGSSTERKGQESLGGGGLGYLFTQTDPLRRMTFWGMLGPHEIYSYGVREYNTQGRQPCSLPYF